MTRCNGAVVSRCDPFSLVGARRSRWSCDPRSLVGARRCRESVRSLFAGRCKALSLVGAILVPWSVQARWSVRSGTRLSLPSARRRTAETEYFSRNLLTDVWHHACSLGMRACGPSLHGADHLATGGRIASRDSETDTTTALRAAPPAARTNRRCDRFCVSQHRRGFRRRYARAVCLVPADLSSVAERSAGRTPECPGKRKCHSCRSLQRTSTDQATVSRTEPIYQLPRTNAVTAQPTTGRPRLSKTNEVKSPARQPSHQAPTRRSHLAPTGRSDSAPIRRSHAAPTSRSNLHPTSRSDSAPTRRSDLAPTSRSDLAPTSRSDLAPTRRSHLAPTRRSNLAPTLRSHRALINESRNPASRCPGASGTGRWRSRTVVPPEARG